MSRRQIVATFAISMTMITAGCGFITGQEALSFSAPPGTASGQAVSETGYEEVNVTEQVVTRNFSAADQTRQVEVTNQLANTNARLMWAHLVPNKLLSSLRLRVRKWKLRPNRSIRPPRCPNARFSSGSKASMRA